MKYLFQLDTLITCLLVFGTAYGLFYLPMNFDFLSPMKQAIGDFDITDMAQSQFRDDDRASVDTNIVLVNISTADRPHIADLLNRISAQQPKVIGIDAMFRKPKGDSIDQPLAQAISHAGNVVLGADIQYNEGDEVFTHAEYSHSLFSQNAAYNGFVNFITDDKKSFRTVREFSGAETVGKEQILSFPVLIAQVYDKKSADNVLARANKTEIINFRGNTNCFYAFDYDEVVDSTADLSVMKDKIVLMGFLGERMDTTVTSLEDVFFTPMNKRYAGKTFPDMYGVVIHANIISQILHGEHINTMSDFWTYALSIIICLVNIAIFNVFEERSSKWYDTFTIVSILFQSIFCTFAIVYVFHTFLYKMNMTLTLAVLALTPTVHEIYHNTIKPLVVEAWMRMRNRRRRKKSTPLPPQSTALLFLCVGLMFLSSSLWSQEMKVLSVRGKVNVVKGKALRTGMKLNTSDKITIGDKGSVSLLHSSGRSIDVNKAGTYSVGDLMAQAQKGGKGFSSKFANYVYSELTETSDAPNSDSHKKNMKTTGSVERVGGDRQKNVDALTEILQDVGVAEEGQSLNENAANVAESVLEDDYLTVIMPRSSYLLESALTFRWFKNSGAQSYTIVVVDALGTEVLRKTVSDTTCAVDIAAEKLERGRNYYWRVVRGDKPSVRSTEYCLHLLPEAQAKAARDTLNGIESELGNTPFASIVKAQYAEDAGLHLDAVKNYNEAINASANEDYKRYYRNYLRRLNLFDAARTIR